VTDHDQPVELAGDAVVAAGSAVAADTVLNDEMPVVDVDLEPVAWVGAGAGF
jgi:hypothetical protein